MSVQPFAAARRPPYWLRIALLSILRARAFNTSALLHAHVASGGRLLVTANHLSFLDGVLIALTSPIPKGHSARERPGAASSSRACDRKLNIHLQINCVVGRRDLERGFGSAALHPLEYRATSSPTAPIESDDGALVLLPRGELLLVGAQVWPMHAHCNRWSTCWTRARPHPCSDRSTRSRGPLSRAAAHRRGGSATRCIGCRRGPSTVRRLLHRDDAPLPAFPKSPEAPSLGAALLRIPPGVVRAHRPARLPVGRLRRGTLVRCQAPLPNHKLPPADGGPGCSGPLPEVRYRSSIGVSDSM